MKFTNILAFAAIAASLGLGSCAENLSTAPQASSMSLEGKWDYRATDGYDLSNTGIAYTFNGTRWTYQLGEAGTKQYEISTSPDHFTATLKATTFDNGEQVNTSFEGSYAIHGDTLSMTYDGHTATLLRAAN